MKRSWVASLILTATIGLSAWLHISESRAAPDTVVTLCYGDVDVRPWHYRKGGGLDFQLLERTGKKAGIAFRYESLPWQRCLARLRAGEVDGAFGTGLDAEQGLAGLGFGSAEPLHTERYVMLRRKNGQLDWDGKSVQGATRVIAVLPGHALPVQLRGQRIAVDDASASSVGLLRRLAGSEVAGAVVPAAEAEIALKRYPDLAAQLEVLPGAPGENPAHLILSREFTRARPELAERIRHSLEAARGSAAYRMLERQTLAVFGPA